MKPTQFDAVVVGSGQAGTPLATALARSGRRTALVERSHVGGTCVNVGCTPTKAMIASARVAHLARKAADYGVVIGPGPTPLVGPVIDPIVIELPRVRARAQAVVGRFRAGNERGLRDAGVELVRGAARFTGPRSISVTRSNRPGELSLTADVVVINTGARPARPRILGLERVPVLDSTSMLDLETLPRHLVVLGGGYVGVEFAQMFRRFGCATTLVQRGAQLLPHEDTDVADAVRDVLVGDGIDVLLNAEVTCARVTVTGTRVMVRVDGGTRAIDATHVLLATGRVPDVAALDLSAAGVEVDADGYVVVNDRLETTASGVFAAGDVVRGPAFTHVSYDDFRVLRAILIEGRPASTRGRLVPYTVFLDPQLAGVGLTERQARALGHEVRVVRMAANKIARAIETGATGGVLKAVIDARSDQILGCSFLCEDAGELMSVVQVAMMGRLPYTALRDGVFAHPTWTESLNNLFAALPVDSGTDANDKVVQGSVSAN
jgi:pyruvate/2-oxoglutarate dehydrogenase complex dihydrolipoamide dehydrogenase (E3) component